MKKMKIYLGIAILALLLLLTGCDAILESMFPEFADTDTYTIEIEAELIPSAILQANTQIAGIVVPKDTYLNLNDEADAVDPWYDMWYGTMLGNLYFDSVQAGTNWVWLWIDYNGNSLFDGGSEMPIQAYWWETCDKDFPCDYDEDGYYSYYGYAWTW